MQKKHLVLAVLVTLVWGVNFPLTKLGLRAIDPFVLTGIRFALAALPDQREPKPLHHCTGNFEHQYGLPCSHRIFDCLMNGTPLRRSQISMRW